MVDTSKILNFDKRVQAIENKIESVADFPIKGILFRDITTLLESPKEFKDTIDIFYEAYKDKKLDAIVAADARGFLFGSALAYLLGCKLVLVRKKGKLPRKCISQSYQLEYGSATLELSEASLKASENVLLIDDLLATGGTAAAMVELVKQLNVNIVSFAFVIDLFDLGGSKLLEDKYGIEVFSLVKFPGH